MFGRLLEVSAIVGDISLTVTLKWRRVALKGQNAVVNQRNYSTKGIIAESAVNVTEDRATRIATR
jgi:hypothetical protein